MPRLDHLIRKELGLSDAESKRLFVERGVTRRGACCKKSFLVADLTGIEVDQNILEEIRRDRLSRASLKPNPNVQISTLYEDQEIWLIHKPANIHCFPQRASESKTVLGALLSIKPEIRKIGPEKEPAILHRLDFETEGVLLVAKTQLAYKNLREQFKRKQIEKRYLAVTSRPVDFTEKILSGKIRSHPRIRKRVSVIFKKNFSLFPEKNTFLEKIACLKIKREASLLEIQTHTGVRHQVRATLATLGIPLRGDTLYGGVDASNLALLAFGISFQHPHGGRRFIFELTKEKSSWISRNF